MKKAGKPQVMVKINLPFQYTPEGRAEIERQREIRLKQMRDAKPTTDVTGADLASVETRVLASLEDFYKDNRFYSAAEPDPNVTPVKDEREYVRSHASYLSPLIEEPDGCVQIFKRAVRAVDFDTVVGTGISGTLAAVLFARALGINYAIVRKDNDGTHSTNSVEGVVGRRWIFVDDLICSGETRRRVIKAMKQFGITHSFDTERVGDYLFYNGKFHPREPNGNL